MRNPWTYNTGRYSDESWFARGVERPERHGGLGFHAFINLDTGAEVIIWPLGSRNSDTEAYRRYKVWLLPPDGASAKQLHLRADCTYGEDEESGWMHAQTRALSEVRALLGLPE